MTKGAIGEFRSYFSASTTGPPEDELLDDDEELLELDEELELEEELELLELDDELLEEELELDDELLVVAPPQAPKVRATVEISTNLESRVR
jgi:hypothetical protein